MIKLKESQLKQIIKNTIISEKGEQIKPDNKKKFIAKFEVIIEADIDICFEVPSPNFEEESSELRGVISLALKRQLRSDYSDDDTAKLLLVKKIEAKIKE